MTRSSSHRFLWELRKYKHSFVHISWTRCSRHMSNVSCYVRIRHRGKWSHEFGLRLLGDGRENVFLLKWQGLLSPVEEWMERMWQFSEHWKFLSWALCFCIPRLLASLDFKNLNNFYFSAFRFLHHPHWTPNYAASLFHSPRLCTALSSQMLFYVFQLD